MNNSFGQAIETSLERSLPLVPKLLFISSLSHLNIWIRIAILWTKGVWGYPDDWAARHLATVVARKPVKVFSVGGIVLSVADRSVCAGLQEGWRWSGPGRAVVVALRAELVTKVPWNGSWKMGKIRMVISAAWTILVMIENIVYFYQFNVFPCDNKLWL